MNKKQIGYLYFVFAIGIFIGIILIDNKKSNEIKLKHHDFLKSKITGTVYSISQNRGVVTMKLKDSKTYNFGISRNYNLNPYDIEKFIQKGDSVYKSANSNKMIIYRDKNEYFFLIDKSINKN